VNECLILYGYGSDDSIRVVSSLELVLFDCDAQLFQKSFLDLSPAHLYIIVEYQISAQNVITRVLLLLSLQLLPHQSLLL
jgi:hypothetical protein